MIRTLNDFVWVRISEFNCRHIIHFFPRKKWKKRQCPNHDITVSLSVVTKIQPAQLPSYRFDGFCPNPWTSDANIPVAPVQYISCSGTQEPVRILLLQLAPPFLQTSRKQLLCPLQVNIKSSHWLVGSICLCHTSFIMCGMVQYGCRAQPLVRNCTFFCRRGFTRNTIVM